MSDLAPPSLSSQRGISDDAVARRSNTSRSIPSQRSPPIADRPAGNRSSSFRTSTFGSLFRDRIDVNAANATPQPPPQPQQQSNRPVSAYYPSFQQQTMNRPTSSSFSAQQQGPNRPVSGSFSTQQTAFPPNNSSARPPPMQGQQTYLGMPAGMPAPLPNPYDPMYSHSSFQQQQQQQHPSPQQHYPHSPNSAPSSYHHFNRPPPMSAPAGYGNQFQSQQQQQQYNYAGHHQSPPPPPAAPSTDSDLEAVIRASEASAAEESRKRQERERQEEEHYLALHKSEEQERQRKQAEEEEEMLAEAMRISQMEEKEQQRKRLEREREEEEAAQLLLEESRQSALREEEERMKRQHFELIERSKREAEEEEQKRKYALEQERLMEEAAVKESLRELEEEWKRREEAERANALHVQQGGQIGDASYWHNLDQKKAYDLASEMTKRYEQGGISQASSSASTSTTVRPLPPTPGMAALAAGVELPKRRTTGDQRNTIAEEQDEQEWELSDDELIEGSTPGGNLEDDGQDPFTDKAEAPPMYDDVGSDRPPEAPTTIPSTVQFVRPDFGPQAEHNNTISNLSFPQEKSAAFNPQSSLQSPENGQIASSSHTQQQPPVPSRPLPKPRISSKLLPTLPPSDESNQAESSSQSHSIEPAQANSTSESLALTEESREFQQKAMKGTDFGYSSEPFGTELFLQNSSGEVETDSSSQTKTKFPNLILLRKANVDGSLRDHSCFFVVRAPSWKALVRALAWYGNTRIEPGPEEVVDHGNGIPLRIVIEFVTPSKAGWTSSTAIVENQSARVSVCFSLSVPALQEESSKPLMNALKKSSHALDASYLRQGVTRRVIELPSKSPKMPLDLVTIAQILHRAHTFSAACPSTGATALHSPRDLHYAVERHDVGYVAKLQRKRREGGTLAVVNSTSASASTKQVKDGPISSSSSAAAPDKSPGGGNSENRRRSGILQPSNVANMSGNAAAGSSSQTLDGNGQNEEILAEVEEEEEQNHNNDDGQGDILDAGAVEIVDGDDYGSGRMARLRAHVQRRLGKRSGDPRLVDQDLESWITPYDMTQHG